MSENDPFELRRFVDAQTPVWAAVLARFDAGRPDPRSLDALQ